MLFVLVGSGIDILLCSPLPCSLDQLSLLMLAQGSLWELTAAMILNQAAHRKGEETETIGVTG